MKPGMVSLASAAPARSLTLTGQQYTDEKHISRASWLLLAFNVLAVLALELRQPLAIDVPGLAVTFLATIALGGTAMFYTRWRPNRNFSAMSVGLMQILLFSGVGALLSYLLAREGGALQDNMLERWDLALGLDWLAYVRWADQYPWLVHTYTLAYVSLIPQIIIIVLVQGFSGRLLLMRQTLFAAMLCGTITVLLSAVIPSIGKFIHLGLTPKDFVNVNPFAGYLHLEHYTALRNGTLTTLSLPDMKGIITFPSYHAGLAAVLLWSFARTPWLRIPGVLLAATTIAATPIDGGHYFVDVIAGIAIAALSIVTALYAGRWGAKSA